MTFISFEKPLRHMLQKIISDDLLHAKWLNTLSYLENCGARQIAACEHPTLVREEMLKHAAEEFRHAYYLKRQMERVTAVPMENYASDYLLGDVTTLQYLKSLNVKVSRYLLNNGVSNDDLKSAAYLLVTYAIEMRAGELYGIYDELLRESTSKVSVRSIIFEEKEHLNEMKEGLGLLPSGFAHAAKAMLIEGNLCSKWICKLETAVTPILMLKKDSS